MDGGVGMSQKRTVSYQSGPSKMVLIIQKINPPQRYVGICHNKVSMLVYCITQENSSEQVKEKLPDKTVVANEVLTDKHPVTRTEVKSVESHPVSTTIPKDANTAPPVVNSNVGAQEVPVNKAEDIEPARTFTEQRVTPLEPVVNSVKHSAPKKETESRIKNSLSQLTEEPISPDGFTHFEKVCSTAQYKLHVNPLCGCEHLWRNRLARSAVNRKVGGSSPPRCEHFFFAFVHFHCMFFFSITYFSMYFAGS